MEFDFFGGGRSGDHFIGLEFDFRTAAFFLVERFSFGFFGLFSRFNLSLLLFFKGDVLRNSRGRCQEHRRRHRSEYKAYKSFIHNNLLMNHAYTDTIF